MSTLISAISLPVGVSAVRAPITSNLYPQGSLRVYIFPGLRFQYATTIKEFQFFTTGTGTLTLCVFRRIFQTSSYEVVATQEVPVPKRGVNTVNTQTFFVLTITLYKVFYYVGIVF